MAKLGKKKTEEVKEKEPVMTPEEKEAIQKEEQRVMQDSANTKRLELATGIVSRKFNLDSDFRVSKFDDKGKVVNLTLENQDFIVGVTIKDSDKQGMYVEN